MFDTYVTVVGNVLTAPEWRRTANTNSLVTNFKVASTARRLDRESGRWVDGNSLRVRVNCWRKLAEGVASSVMVGDPVVVVGRLYTRDWTDTEGNPRTLYEMEAVAVGHDLARGRGRFLRNRPTLTTSAVEDARADTTVRGGATEPVPHDDAPTRPGDGLFDDDPDFAAVSFAPDGGYDPLAVMRGGGFDPTAGPDDVPDERTDGRAPFEDAAAVPAEGFSAAGLADPDSDPVPGSGVDAASDAASDERGGDRRDRRSRGRAPVSA